MQKAIKASAGQITVVISLDGNAEIGAHVWLFDLFKAFD